ncbi:MAG: hypothetical protein RQ745_11890, partial [Longimicrobiales bacterium]|nr:hypothetical protein [Longimicrobiales bacterium]
FDLGYSLQRARQLPSRERLEALVDRLVAFRPSPGSPPRMRGGAELLSRRLVTAIPMHTEPTVRRVVKGAAAGAAASLVRELTAPLLGGRLELPDVEAGLPERLASGAARGALFAAVIDPRLPGPVALRGAVHAAIEYLLAPGGGLTRWVGGVAPWRILPGADGIVQKLEAGEETLIDHLVFGLALALMLGEV